MLNTIRDIKLAVVLVKDQEESKRRFNRIDAKGNARVESRNSNLSF